MQKTELTAEAVVQELSALLAARLSAVYRFGSEFARKPGTVRLLVLVDRLDRALLDQLSPLVERCRQGSVRLRLDTADDVLRGADTFPVFCLEFRATRELLHGEDVLAGLIVDPANLRLRVEQGLRVARRDLVQAYLDDHALLAVALRRVAHRMLYLLEGLLQVGGAESTEQRSSAETFEAAASKHLSQEDAAVWSKLHQFGSFELSLEEGPLLELYADVLRTLRSVVDVSDAMDPPAG